MTLMRVLPFPESTEPLIEGVSPDPLDVKMAAQEIRLNEYGDYVPYTRMMLETMGKGMFSQLERQLSNSAAGICNKVTSETLRAGLNVLFAGGKLSTDALAAGDTLTISMLKSLSAWYGAQGIPKFPGHAEGGHYKLFCSYAQAYDLSRDPDYSDQQVFTVSDGKRDTRITLVDDILVVPRRFTPVLGAEPLDDAGKTQFNLSASANVGATSLTAAGAGVSASARPALPTKHPRASSKRTAQAIRDTLKQALEHACENNLLAANPANKLKIPKVEIEKTGDDAVKAFEPELRARILKAVEVEKLMKAVIMTLFFTGMRIGEALALPWENVDFEKSTINIDRAIAVSPEYDEDFVKLSRKTRVGDAKTICSNRKFQAPACVIDALPECRGATPTSRRKSRKRSKS
jgi:hypothetical protein